MEITITTADQRRLKQQLDRVALLDPGIGELVDQIGLPEPRRRAASFETLLQIIISQQISTAAAAAVFAKLKRHCRGEVTWRKVLRRDVETLKSCGLSVRKAEYARGLAGMFRSGELDLNELAQSSTEDVVKALVQVRGFGRWSAELFAMFSLQRDDCYPADDLALQIAVQWYFELEQRPTGKETARLAERWSPYRSAVALLMWRYYGSATLD